MFKRYKGQFLTIPNILGYIRIFLMLIFVIVYFNAGNYHFAAVIFLISGLTDFLDGKIARHFHIETEFGEILDPVADKLTQGAVVLSLTFRFVMMRYLLMLILLKDVFMGITGFILYKRGKKMDGAQWYGKFNTTFMYFAILILLFSRSLTYFSSGLLIAGVFLVNMFCFISYVVFYIRMIRGVSNEKNKLSKKKTGIVFAVIVLIFLSFEVSSTLSVYSKQPDVSEDMLIDRSEFFGNGEAGESAKILVDNSDALFERVYMIKNAKTNISMSTFDFRADEAGQIMIGALMSAADRGVKVNLLVDGINSWIQMEWNPYFYALSCHENVTVKVYNKANPLVPWKSIARMHDKYLIADNSTYILGGRNTYNRFLGDYSTYQNYDWDVLVYSDTIQENSSVNKLIDYAEKIWHDRDCSIFHNSRYLKRWTCVKNASKDIYTAYNNYISDNESKMASYDYKEDTIPVNKITILSNATNCGMKDPVIWANLTELVVNARERAKIHTPYIICNDVMYRSLEEMAVSDADIILMTNSAPNNDNPVGAAELESSMPDILATGIDLWEFSGERAYHGKSIVIDDNISIIGSFNMDIRSTYLDTELMLVIDSEEINAQMSSYMEKYEKQSVNILSDGTKENPYNVTEAEYTSKRKARKTLIQKLFAWARCFF